jgi:plasmid stabilization system protein ParE
MTIEVTLSAKSQLRRTVRSLRRIDAAAAERFVRDLSSLLAKRTSIDEAATPIADFPDLPTREIGLHGHRLFFRESDGRLWLSGVWRMPDAS